jgi:hypothetical protein
MRGTLRKRCAARSGLPRAATGRFRTIHHPILIETVRRQRQFRRAFHQSTNLAPMSTLAVNRFDFSTHLDCFPDARLGQSAGLESVDRVGLSRSHSTGSRGIDLARCPAEVCNHPNEAILEPGRRRPLHLTNRTPIIRLHSPYQGNDPSNKRPAEETVQEKTSRLLVHRIGRQSVPSVLPG